MNDLQILGLNGGQASGTIFPINKKNLLALIQRELETKSLAGIEAELKGLILASASSHALLASSTVLCVTTYNAHFLSAVNVAISFVQELDSSPAFQVEIAS